MGAAGLRTALMAAAGVALAACADVRAPALQEPHGLAPVAVVAAPLAVPPPYAPIPNDTCGANALGWLVGRSRSEIPIPADLSRRRVACTTCPGTQDARPDRLNILYDLATGRVTKLTCG